MEFASVATVIPPLMFMGDVEDVTIYDPVILLPPLMFDVSVITDPITPPAT
ncbi:hypothetical protein DSECCO2_597340 [anaerobic digester metagenome]